MCTFVGSYAKIEGDTTKIISYIPGEIKAIYNLRCHKAIIAGIDLVVQNMDNSLIKLVFKTRFWILEPVQERFYLSIYVSQKTGINVFVEEGLF